MAWRAVISFADGGWLTRENTPHFDVEVAGMLNLGSVQNRKDVGKLRLGTSLSIDNTTCKNSLTKQATIKQCSCGSQIS